MSTEDNQFGAGQQQQQVNLGKLFSDVSRTVSLQFFVPNNPFDFKVSGFRNILGQADPINTDLQSNLKLPLADSQMPSNTGSQSSGSPLSGLFGGGSTCFKTCGMEDIQVCY